MKVIVAHALRERDLDSAGHERDLDSARRSSRTVMHARPPSPAQRAFALKSMFSSLELLPTLLAFGRRPVYHISLSIHPVIHPSIQASIHLHIHLPTYVCIYLCNLSISNLSISLFRPSIHASIHPIHQVNYLRSIRLFVLYNTNIFQFRKVY